MQVFAYVYYDPRLDTPPLPNLWGWEVDRVYQDLGGLSQRPSANAIAEGASPDMASTRPQLAQLLQDCTTERPTYVLVRRLDELGESLQQVHQCLTQLEDLGIVVMATEQDYRAVPQPVTSPVIRQGDDFMRLLDDIQASQRSRCIRQGHARNRVKTLPPPGKPPFGYRRGKDRYVIDRATAPLIREFVERFLLFGSLRGAVRFLEKKYGKKIAVSTGQRWLTSPVYRGDLLYRGKDIIPNTHAPIISREDAAQVDRLLRRNRRLPPRTASAPRSLAGLVTCATCQSAMTVTQVSAPRRDKTYLYLRPVACTQQPKCKSIAYQTILDKTIAVICQALPQAVSAVPPAAMGGMKDAIAAQIQAKQTILDQLPTLVAQGILDQATADLRAYTVQTEIAQIRQQQSQLPPINLLEIAQTVSIPQFWQDLSEAERRFYFREFIQQIKLVREEDDWAIELQFIF